MYIETPGHGSGYLGMARCFNVYTANFLKPYFLRAYHLAQEAHYATVYTV